MRSATRFVAWWLGCSVVLLAGCNALIGIEDLSSEGGDASAQGPEGGNGGGRKDGGSSSGTGGKSGVDRDGGAGSSGNGGVGGKGGSSGKGGEGGGAAGDEAGASGSEADGGTPDGGTPDSGTGPVTPTVHGKVIDYYRNPVPGVAVQIGSASTTTDASGEFTLDDVSDTYDTSLTVTAQRYGNPEVAGWLFVGLTRRDPTFQVYRGLPLTSGNVDVKIQNVTFPMPSDDKIEVAFSSGNGQYNLGLDAMETNTSIDWEGLAQVSGTAHALRWSNASTTPYLPTAYLARDDHPLALDETAGANLEIDLMSSANLPTGLVSGTATGPAFADRANAVFLRYDDGAAIQLVDERSAPDSYSYLVPSLPNTSIVVAASVNTSSYAPFAVAYADAVTPGTSGISLVVPSPATPLTPGGGTSNVTPDTNFTWSGSDQVYMVRFENVNFYETYYVITAAKEAHIPAPPITNLPLSANADYTWSVRTHIKYDSVDDATGATGFLDAYCYGEISGPAHGNGTHTRSTELAFKTAP